MASDAAAVDARIREMPRPQRDTLLALRNTLRRVLPHADECLKYGMPSFTVQGVGVAAYDAFKDHCSYFPFSGRVLESVGEAASAYVRTKGALRFPIDRPPPVALVRKLVRLRLDEISDVANGRRLVFYANGAVKAVGSMRDGLQNGHWKWYRQDGTLLRAGQFTRGTRSGTWRTYDRDSRLVRTTEF